MFKFLLTLFLTTLVSLPQPVTSLPTTKSTLVPVTVLKVLDGDTLRVLYNNQKVYIRLACLDSPEIAHNTKQALDINSIRIQQYSYGNLAKFYLEQLTPISSTIYLNIYNTDKYGRLVAEVYSDSSLTQSVQEDLISQGLAQLYPPYYKTCSNYDTLVQLEQQAKQHSLGIWSEPSFLPAWNFRKLYK